MHAEWDGDAARAIIERLKPLDGAALPILHALLDAFGYVDRQVVPDLAAALNLSRAEIVGILTFYHDFREAPAKGRIIRLCRAEACQAQGCETLRAEAEALLGTPVDGEAGKGGIALETVYCLGNCALGPAALVDGMLVGRLDSDGLRQLCEGAPVEAVVGSKDRVG